MLIVLSQMRGGQTLYYVARNPESRHFLLTLPWFVLLVPYNL